LILLAGVALALVLGGCDGGTPTSPPTAPSNQAGPTSLASPAPSVAPGGCGTTPVLVGAYPEWVAGAGLPGGMRYLVSHEGNLIGVLFVGQPMAPPHGPPGPNNKILWISKAPREGNPLRLTLTPPGGGTPVTVEETANSGPGEIYPSIVDVPSAGCWTVSAEWGANRATFELNYLPPDEVPL
jgi:hypothetical protein